MKSQSQSWSVFQIGAREHYAIPRALLSHGVPTTLVTDFWFTGSGRGLLPPTLKDRFHPEIPSRNIRSFNCSMLTFEASSRISGVGGWPLIEARNQRFGSLATSVEFDDVVFSYSYAALDIFQKARMRSRLMLGQIDPGQFEQDLVDELHERHGLPRPPRPSVEYWDRWREEHQLADVIVANSAWSREALVQCGVPPDKIAVIPLAYEVLTHDRPVRSYPREFTRDRPLEILFLGQVIVRKGILELLDAARILRNAPVQWTIVGGGDKNLMVQLATQPGVELVGSVPRSTAGQYYSRADAFILPTHSDGFALTQLEAAAAGLPLIVSKHCGDVVRHLESGILLPTVTSEAIVEAVEMVLAQPALLETMSSQAGDLSSFSLRQIGQQLLNAASCNPLQNQDTHVRSI